jgi:hypothetical protein
MMDADAKITLSAEELQLVQHTGWILTKRAVMDKVGILLSRQIPLLQAQWQAHPGLFPPALQDTLPKISKGENYRGLPYMVLDYPALFGREDCWAVRTLFWWGHFFSVTLLVSGRYKTQYQQALLQNLPLLQQHNCLLGVHASPWQHHLQPDNYVPAGRITAVDWENLLMQKEFCKITVTISLNDWEAIAPFLQTVYQYLPQWLQR